MLSLSIWSRNGGSPLTSLCEDAGLVEPSFLPFWCVLDSFLYSEGNPSWMEWTWQMTPLCLFWSVWKERNRLAFGNEELSLQRLKYSFVCNLWSWVKVSLVASPSSLVSFLGWIGF